VSYLSDTHKSILYVQIAAKRDPNLDQKAQEWIESIIGEKFPDVPYEDALKNGVILCKYILILFCLFHCINYISIIY
jgi:hypothetical protein